MPPDDEDRASLVDMLGFAREVVAFSRERSRMDLEHRRHAQYHRPRIWPS
jgi:hypothetical protein